MNEFPHIPDDVRAMLPDPGRPTLALLNYWCSIRVGSEIPNRREVDPTGIGRYLSKIYLYEFDAALGDFVCRLAGEEVHEAWGARIRGRSFREIVGDEHHVAALTRWRAVVETPLVQFGIMEDEDRGQRTRVGERLIMPLRGDNGDVNLILGVGDYGVRQNDRGWIPPVWHNVIRIACADIPESSRETGT